MILGLAIRFVHLGLPHAATKYGGSALWAIAIFWLVSLLLSRRTTATRAALAFFLAIAIECFKLVRTPPLDALRRTLPGQLLLGRVFALRDILAYTLAIALAAVLDHALRRRRASSQASGTAQVPGTVR